MEEKLRNLSQNIENNTGENAHKPDENPPEEREESAEPTSASDREDTPVEEKHENHEEHHDEETPWEGEEASDYTPEPEEKPEEPKEEPEEEPEEDVQDDSGKARPETVSRNSHENFEESEPRDDGSERTGSKDERFGDKAAEEPKILTMDSDDDDEPKESPTRTKKYSPEVEAALNRLNAEDAAVDLSEPLSTEPKKKHHGAHIFLFILFLLAVAAVTLCILVEQKIIDNPFPNIFNKQESSQTVPATNKTDTKTETPADDTNANTKTESETTEPTRGSTSTETQTEVKTNTKEQE